MAIVAASLETRLDANTAQHDAKIRASGQHLGALGQSADRSKQQLVGAFSGMDSGASRLATTFSGLVPGIGAVGLAVGAVVGVLTAATKAAMDEDVGIQRLTQALQNNIPAWDGNTAAVERTIEGRQRLGFADDKLRDSLAALVTRTHDVAQAFDVQAIAMDFARGRNIDLQTATQILGKVYDGNIGILSRYGVAVREGASATEALAQVQATYAGQAEAYGQTAAGSVERLKIAFDNAMETVGSAVLPLVAQLATLFADLLPKIMGVVTTITDFLKPAFELIGIVLNAIGTSIDWLGERLGLWKDDTQEASAQVSSSFSQMSSNVGGSLTDIEGRFTQHAAAVSDAGWEAGTGYGTNVSGGLDASMADIDASANDVYDALDIRNKAGDLGKDVGYVYVYGGPGGVTPAIYGGTRDVSLASNSVVASMDKRVEAGQMGAAVGSAMTSACAATVQNGLLDLRNQANVYIANISASTSAAASTVGSGLPVPIIPAPSIIAPRASAPPTSTAPPLGAPGAPIGATVAPVGGPVPGWDLPSGVQLSGYEQWLRDQDRIAEQKRIDDQKARDAQAAGRGGGSGRSGGGSGGSGKSAKDDAVSALKAALDQTKQVSDAIKAAYSSLGMLGDFKLPGGFDAGVEELTVGVDKVMMRLQGVALKFSGEGLAHLSTFNDAAKSGMDLVKSGVEALTKVKDFQAPTEEAIGGFTDSLQFVMGKLGDVAQKWSVESLAKMTVFSEGTGASMDMVSKSVDALGKLKDFKKPADEAMTGFVDAVDFLIDKFRSVTAKWDQQSLAQAAQFGESTGKFMDGVGKSFDLLSGLGDFKKPGDAAMSGFVDAVDFLSDKFRRVTVKWDEESLKSAVAFGEGTGKLIGGVGSSADLLGKLVDFKKPADAAMTGFVDATDYLSDQFRRVVVKWDKDSLDSAALYGAGAGKLISGVGGGVDTLLKLGSFKKPSDDAMRGFADALDYQTDILRTAISKWDKDSLAIAAFYGESMGKLMVGLGQAIDPLMKLDGFKRASREAVDAFFDTLSDVTIAFGHGAAKFKEYIGPTGAEVAKSIGEVTAGLGQAMDPLLKLGEFKRPGKEQIDAFFGGLVDFILEFGRRAADFQGQASPIMATLAKNIGEIAAGFGAAFDPLLKVGDVQTISKEQIEGAMSNVWELLNQADIVMKGMPADFAPRAKNFASGVGDIFGAIKSGFEVASAVGGETGGSIGQGFSTALGSAELLVAYIVGDATTAVLNFKRDAHDLRNSYVQDMSDMASSTEEYARRAKAAFDSVIPPGSQPPSAPPVVPPATLPPISPQAATGKGNTTMYNPVFIDGGIVADATPEEHAMLRGLGLNQRRKARGVVLPG